MTIYVIVGIIGITIFYDLFAFIKGGFNNTISWVVYSSSMKYPILAFFGGLLAGHFWWSQIC